MKISRLSMLLSACVLSMNAGATPNVVFLDQDQGPGQTNPVIQFPNSAAWTESDFFPQAYGPTYSFDRRDGSSGGPYLAVRTNGALDPFAGPTGGGTTFDVYGRWSQGNGRCSNVRIEVRRNNGASLVLSTTRDMRPEEAGFNWQFLGTVSAVPGQNYEVRYYANNTISSTIPGSQIGCVVSPDGAMFVKRTFDGSDIFNLNALDIIDEAGVDFSSAGSRSLSSPAVNVCNSYTQLTSIIVSVPASSGNSYVVCSAAGEVDHNVLNNLVRVGIDAVPNTTDATIPDRSRVLEPISINSEEDRTPWAVQNVYTFSSAGGSQRYALKACRQATTTTGSIIWDPLVCEVFPTRR